jgi:hypothetical protein
VADCLFEPGDDSHHTAECTGNPYTCQCDACVTLWTGIEADRKFEEGKEEDLYGLLNRDSAQVNAFFREYLTSIVCSPIEEEDQQFYRACGAVNGTALMVTLGLVKECDFGGCGGALWVTLF